MSLLSNFLTVITGRLAAQLVMIACMPVLARIFLPEHFGVISLLTSLTQAPMALLMLRYEQALPQCKDDAEAGALVGLCLKIAGVGIILLFVAAAVGAPMLAEAFKTPELRWFVPILPAMLSAQCLGVLGKQWAAYRERFVPVALTDGLSTAARRVIPIPLGLTIFPTATGMFIGFVLAPLTSAIIMVKSFAGDVRRHVNFSREAIGTVARTYRNFPIHLSGVAIFNMASLAAPAIILGLYWSMTEVGWFGQAFALLSLPVSLFTQAAARALYPRLAKEHQAGKETGGLIGRMLTAELDLGLYPLCALAVVAPDVWAIFLGEEFRMSGYLGRMLVPDVILTLLWSPLSVAVNVLHRQRALLFQTAVLATLRIGALWIGAAYGSLIGAVLAYSLVNAVFKTGQLVWILRCTGTPVGVMARGIVIRVLGVGILIAGLVALRHAQVHIWLQLGAAALGWGVYMVVALRTSPETHALAMRVLRRSER
jgi:O-antigen/teichoic acid export membrane protein